MNLEESQIKILVDKAIDAKNYSYSPYSKFRVGCSLLTIDDTFFTGCNVENASYGLCICAERTALVKAVSEGYKKFKAICVASDVEKIFVAPCGACRQFIAEFGLDWTCILVRTKEDLKFCKIREILPLAFEPSALDMTENSV
ncbi:cytidine deaminase-like [Brachionus plicatilis]|uniref:Cytidine deaminase n=1 Tax=Brachionus plicatilis TaxID=10195 RepID=A0A3M7QU41_BRAPC|nr:cytidine deaminase-like [Brachionus plicatilis]